MSEIAQFKQYVQNYIEETLDKCPNQGYEKDEDGNVLNPRPTIAQTTFAFKNKDMIELLKQRGTQLDKD